MSFKPRKKPDDRLPRAMSDDEVESWLLDTMPSKEPELSHKILHNPDAPPCPQCPNADCSDFELCYQKLEPCPRCLPLVLDGTIRPEMLQPIYNDARDPYAIDGSGRCCRDCGAADTLTKLGQGHPDWPQTRLVIGNDRAEQMRLPGAPMGLVKLRYMRASVPGEFEAHHKWLDKVLPPRMP